MDTPAADAPGIQEAVDTPAADAPDIQEAVTHAAPPEPELVLEAAPHEPAIVVDQPPATDNEVAQESTLKTGLKPGARALISGLKGRPKLNGTLGTILSFDEDKGRFAVKLSSNEQILLKPANLSGEVSPTMQLASQQEEIKSLTGRADSAFQSGVPSQCVTAGELYMQAAELCSRRRKALEATFQSEVGKPADQPEVAWAWRQQSETYGLAAQALLRVNKLDDAEHAARLSMEAAASSGQVPRQVDATATHATVLIRRGQVEEAQGELEASLALCDTCRLPRDCDDLPVAAATGSGGPMTSSARDVSGADPSRLGVGAPATQAEREELLGAEAVTRSALGRVLVALGQETEAREHMAAGVALRREYLTLVAKTSASSLEQLHEARRRLSSTLINYAAILAQATQGSNGVNMLTDARAALGEARALAQLVGDAHNEQAALTALVNLRNADDAPADGETHDEAAALKALLAQSGRTDGGCAVCLEPLGEHKLTGLRCGHLYHAECLARWADHSNKCPTCCGEIQTY